jgi:hypothetical protein
MRNRVVIVLHCYDEKYTDLRLPRDRHGSVRYLINNIIPHAYVLFNPRNATVNRPGIKVPVVEWGEKVYWLCEKGK